MITSVRAPLPMAEVPRQPRPAEVQALPGAKPGAGVPVAAPIRAEAVHQVPEKPRPEDPPFLAVQGAAAAEAAKAAYIRARIAAGLNPLPLP